MTYPQRHTTRCRRAWWVFFIWVIGFELLPGLHKGLHHHLGAHSHNGASHSHQEDKEPSFGHFTADAESLGLLKKRRAKLSAKRRNKRVAKHRAHARLHAEGHEHEHGEHEHGGEDEVPSTPHHDPSHGENSLEHRGIAVAGAALVIALPPIGRAQSLPEPSAISQTVTSREPTNRRVRGPPA